MIPRKGTETFTSFITSSTDVFNFLNDSPKGDGNVFTYYIIKFNHFLFSKWFPERGRKQGHRHFRDTQTQLLFSKWFPERGRKPNFYNFWVLKLRPADFLNDSPKGDGNLKGTSWVHGHDRTPFSKWFPERGRKLNAIKMLVNNSSMFKFSKWFPERGRKLSVLSVLLPSSGVHFIF